MLVLHENSELLPDVDEGCIREDKLGSTDLASWSDESETQTAGEDDKEVQNAQNNYDYEDESDDNNVIIEDAEDESDDNNVIIDEDTEDESGDSNVIAEGDTDESFGTRDNHYNDISNNENIQKFSSFMLPPMKSMICYGSFRDDGWRTVDIISRGRKATE